MNNRFEHIFNALLATRIITQKHHRIDVVGINLHQLQRL
ncbi:hypothetical Protein YC6258_02688 [Gynuella sunshinyii YC6258]|uniref:Uncharacterized protein n=1 Tax=Gynuella sunshinyii YC6258 TaxID=1445510 RepID=A0A0C5VKD3_9GAMM|nr:hypothetical Protein YC6258_02688 [Gynuella sunshinyii YC6258]